MLKLLRFELHKLIRQKSFYICLAVLILMIVFSAYTTQLSLADTDIADPTLNGLDYMMSAVSGSVLTMILGVFIPLFVCEDYVSGTIRNIVTRGYTRLSIFTAKLIVVLLASVFMGAACMAAAYGLGTAFWGAGAEFGSEQVKILLCQLAVVAATAALFYAISTLLQKTGGSIAVCLVLPIAAAIILALIDTALAEHELDLASYWIDRVGRTLAFATVEADVIKKSLIISLCYFAVSTLGSWFAVMKREY